MSDTTVTDDSPDQVEPDEQPPASLASRVILWLVFAILYAYPLFEGISNLIALPAVYRAGGAGDAVPWYLLIVGSPRRSSCTSARCCSAAGASSSRTR